MPLATHAVLSSSGVSGTEVFRGTHEECMGFLKEAHDSTRFFDDIGDLELKELSTNNLISWVLM